MKIYTRTGDDGSTGLVNGSRTSKSNPRVEAYGEVDEVNAMIGLARAEGLDADIDVILETVQRDLFALGSRLADSGERVPDRVIRIDVGPDAVAQLEQWIDVLDAELPALTRFVLPGGDRAAAAIHVARTVCRRAERRMVALGSLAPIYLTYINRLSDLLFVVARAVNRRNDVPEVEW
jgi:cob(I)alamin adenosyltransferase